MRRFLSRRLHRTQHVVPYLFYKIGSPFVYLIWDRRKRLRYGIFAVTLGFVDRHEFREGLGEKFDRFCKIYYDFSGRKWRTRMEFSTFHACVSILLPFLMVIYI